MRRNYILALGLCATAILAACSGPLKPAGAGGGGNGGSVTVTPSTATVSIFGTQQFTASLSGSTNATFTWQVNGVVGGSQATGFVSSAGLYVAPSGVPTTSNGSGVSVLTTVTVTATAQVTGSPSGSATVTIQATPNQSTQSGAIKLGTTGGNVTNLVNNGQTITCCGGTLGSLVVSNNKQFILSNNHVLANSDFGIKGDAISQPGLGDNKCAPGSTVANLSDFFNLQSGLGTKVDAAIAQVVPGKVDAGGNILLLGSGMTNGVPDPGPPHAGAGITATPAETVAKSGRSTGLTCSSVFAVNMTTGASGVAYSQHCDGTGTKFTASYTNLVVVSGGGFSAEGDSGSLIVDQNSADPVALLFAGNDQDSVGNAISDVLNFFTQSSGFTTSFVGSAATHQVIGCTLPVKPANAVKTLSVATLSAERLQNATTIRDAHGPELMAHPEVQAVGVGASYDNPAETAILLFVTQGQPRSDLPAEVDGVRTRVIEGQVFAQRGVLSAIDSAALEQSAAAPKEIYSVSENEIARAKIVHTAHAQELVKLQGVQGVGITSSVDSPGDAALLVYFIRGVEHAAIPAVIDGLRTRVREGSPFRAGLDHGQTNRGCPVPKAPTLKAQKTAATGLVP